MCQPAHGSPYSHSLASQGPEESPRERCRFDWTNWVDAPASIWLSSSNLGAGRSKEIPDNEEKDSAFWGPCTMVEVNPGGITKVCIYLLQALIIMLTCTHSLVVLLLDRASVHRHVFHALVLLLVAHPERLMPEMSNVAERMTKDQNESLSSMRVLGDVRRGPRTSTLSSPISPSYCLSAWSTARRGQTRSTAKRLSTTKTATTAIFVTISTE